MLPHHLSPPAAKSGVSFNQFSSICAGPYCLPPPDQTGRYCSGVSHPYRADLYHSNARPVTVISYHAHLPVFVHPSIRATHPVLLTGFGPKSSVYRSRITNAGAPNSLLRPPHKISTVPNRPSVVRTPSLLVAYPPYERHIVHGRPSVVQTPSFLVAHPSSQRITILHRIRVFTVMLSPKGMRFAFVE